MNQPRWYKLEIWLWHHICTTFIS